MDDQRKAPITPPFTFSSRNSSRHGAGSWHPPTEQPQALPLWRHIPPRHAPSLPRPQCWSLSPVAPRCRRSRCSCIIPCRFSRFRRLTRTTHHRHRAIMWGQTGILSGCLSGHHISITEDQVVWMFPNRGIPWHMSQGKVPTLGTVAKEDITYRLEFRCPLPRPFPRAHMGRTI